VFADIKGLRRPGRGRHEAQTSQHPPGSDWRLSIEQRLARPTDPPICRRLSSSDQGPPGPFRRAAPRRRGVLAAKLPLSKRLCQEAAVRQSAVDLSRELRNRVSQRARRRPRDDRTRTGRDHATPSERTIPSATKRSSGPGPICAAADDRLRPRGEARGAIPFIVPGLETGLLLSTERSIYLTQVENPAACVSNMILRTRLSLFVAHGQGRSPRSSSRGARRGGSTV
jgi:hypothetical protein